MQVHVTRRHKTRGAGLTGVLAALGFGTGLAAGFVCGSLFGTGGPRRVGRLVKTAGRVPATRERRAVVLARVREALAADPALRGQSIEPLAGGPTGLVLTGWVSSRAIRARAHRVAESAAGSEPVVNRLLVRGEDDYPVALVVDDPPRSA